jgi:hypothetical protein
VLLKGVLVYFWLPPVSLQRAGVLEQQAHGPDFEIAVSEARSWEATLEAHRGAINAVRRRLNTIRSGTVGHPFG